MFVKCINHLNAPNLKIEIVFIVFKNKLNLKFYQNYTKLYFYNSLHINFHFIYTHQEFSRGESFNIGAKFITNSKLIMFCDIDMCFDFNFVQNCFSNAKEGESAYFPIVFSQYFLYQDQFIIDFYKNNISNYLNVNNGIWRIYGYGIVCIYRSDYIKTQGMISSNKWGNEDVQFYYKIIHLTKLQAFRAPDPNIVHLFHFPSCLILNHSYNFFSCVGSNLQLLSSKYNLYLLLNFKNNQTNFLNQN